jgi:hypothetical protein
MNTAPPPTTAIKKRLVQHPRDAEDEVNNRIMVYSSLAGELQGYYHDVCRRGGMEWDGL